MTKQPDIIVITKAERAIREEALDAFWSKVVELHPTARTGDLSPTMDAQLERAATLAILEWRGNNLPAISDEEDAKL